MVVSQSASDMFLADQDTVYLLPGDLSEITSNVNTGAIYFALQSARYCQNINFMWDSTYVQTSSTHGVVDHPMEYAQIVHAQLATGTCVWDDLTNQDWL